MLLGTLTAALLTYSLPERAFFAWGWRIPFLLGFLLGPVGHYLRTRVGETPAFTRSATRRFGTPRAAPAPRGDGHAARPMRDVVRLQHGGMRHLLGISGLRADFRRPGIASQRLGDLLLHYPGLHGLSGPDARGRRIVRSRGPQADAVCRLSGAIVFSYPLFRLLVSRPTVTGLVVTQALAAAILSLTTGVLCAVLAECFPTRVRYTALAISYGFSVAIFGGLAPLISAALYRLTGSPEAPSYYVIFRRCAQSRRDLFCARGRAPSPPGMKPYATVCRTKHCVPPSARPS